MWSVVSWNCWHSLHLPSVFVCNILLAQCFVCNSWSCAGIISHSVSAFRVPPRQLQERSFFKKLSELLIYWSCITLLFHFFFRALLILLLFVVCFFVPLFSFDWFYSSVIFSAVWIVGFVFGWLYSSLLTIFTNWSSILYVQIFCNIDCLCFVCHFSLQQVFSSSFPVYIQPISIWLQGDGRYSEGSSLVGAFFMLVCFPSEKVVELLVVCCKHLFW